jgi:hypothetical protein
MDQPWTEDSVARTLINPNYRLTETPKIFPEYGSNHFTDNS